jgi:prevent-host-death family protein
VAVLSVLGSTTVPAIDVREAKAHLSRLLERVERGEEIVITRHGKVVARLIAAAAADQAEIDGAIVRLKELRVGTSLGGESWKALRDAGRR